jgi:4a-hydroxytetrahydrobiopterin dehydratase
MTLLDTDQLAELSSRRPEWEVGTDAMRRTFTFDDFVGSIGFVTQVALLAEKADHHPDIDVRWNRVTLTLSTHSEGGLTDKDRDLSESIDRLV